MVFKKLLSRLSLKLSISMSRTSSNMKTTSGNLMGHSLPGVLSVKEADKAVWRRGCGASLKLSKGANFICKSGADGVRSELSRGMSNMIRINPLERFRDKTMPRFKLANVQKSAVCERPEAEWISDCKEASGDAIEEMAGSIVSEILERAVKRVINKRKRVKRKLNLKLFKSWALGSFSDSESYFRGIRKKEKKHDCEEERCGRRWRIKTKRVRWSSCIQVSVYSRGVEKEEQDFPPREEERDDQDLDEEGCLGLGGEVEKPGQGDFEGEERSRGNGCESRRFQDGNSEGQNQSRTHRDKEDEEERWYEHDHAGGRRSPGDSQLSWGPWSAGRGGEQGPEVSGRGQDLPGEDAGAGQQSLEAGGRDLKNRMEGRMKTCESLSFDKRNEFSDNQSFVADCRRHLFRKDSNLDLEKVTMSEASGEAARVPRAEGGGGTGEDEVVRVPKMSQECLENVVDNIEHTTVNQMFPVAKQAKLLRGEEVSVEIDVRIHPDLVGTSSDTESLLESEQEDKAERVVVITPDKKGIKKTLDGETVIVPKNFSKKRMTLTAAKNKRIGFAITHAKPETSVAARMSKYQCEIEECYFACRTKKEFMEHSRKEHNGKKLVGTPVSQDRRKTRIFVRNELGAVIPTHVCERGKSVKQWDTIQGALVQVDTASKKAKGKEGAVKKKGANVIKAKMVERPEDKVRKHVIPIVAEKAFTDESEDDSKLIGAKDLKRTLMNGKRLTKKTVSVGAKEREVEPGSGVWKLPSGANSIEDIRSSSVNSLIRVVSTPPNEKSSPKSPATPATVKRKVIQRYKSDQDDSILQERDIHKRDRVNTSDGLSDLSNGSVSLLECPDAPGSSTMKPGVLENKLPATLNFSGMTEGDGSEEEKGEKEKRRESLGRQHQDQSQQVSQDVLENQSSLETQVPPGFEAEADQISQGRSQGSQETAAQTDTFEEDCATIENAQMRRKIGELEKDIEILESSNVVLKVEVMELQDFKARAKHAIQVRDEALDKFEKQKEVSESLMSEILSQREALKKEDVQVQTELNGNNLAQWEYSMRDEEARIKEVKNLELKKNRAEIMQEKLWEKVLKLRAENEHLAKIAEELQKTRDVSEKFAAQQQNYIDMLSGSLKTAEQIGRDKDNKIRNLIAQIPCKNAACEDPKSCGKLHGQKDDKKRMCPQFQAGNCKWGPRCKFSHSRTASVVNLELAERLKEEGLLFDPITGSITRIEEKNEEGSEESQDVTLVEDVQNGRVDNEAEVEEIEVVNDVDVRSDRAQAEESGGDKEKKGEDDKMSGRKEDERFGAIPRVKVNTNAGGGNKRNFKSNSKPRNGEKNDDKKEKGKEEEKARRPRVSKSAGSDRGAKKDEGVDGPRRPKSQVDIREFYIRRSDPSVKSRSRSRGPSPSPGRLSRASSRTLSRTSSRSTSTASFASARSNSSMRGRSKSRDVNNKENMRASEPVMRSYPRKSNLNTPEAVGRWYLNQEREEQRMREALREEEVLRMSDIVIQRLIRDEETNGFSSVESYRRLVREQERRKIREKEKSNLKKKERDEGVLRDNNQMSGNSRGLRGALASDLTPRGPKSFNGLEGEELLMSMAEKRVGLTRQEHLDRLKKLGAEQSTLVSESVFRNRRRK